MHGRGHNRRPSCTHFWACTCRGIWRSICEQLRRAMQTWLGSEEERGNSWKDINWMLASNLPCVCWTLPRDAVFVFQVRVCFSTVCTATVPPPPPQQHTPDRTPNLPNNPPQQPCHVPRYCVCFPVYFSAFPNGIFAIFSPTKLSPLHIPTSPLPNSTQDKHGTRGIPPGTFTGLQVGKYCATWITFNLSCSLTTWLQFFARSPCTLSAVVSSLPIFLPPCPTSAVSTKAHHVCSCKLAHMPASCAALYTAVVHASLA
jgi:hypothetical protein